MDVHSRACEHAVMSLKGIAEETVAIIERGSYETAAGPQVFLRAEIERAVRGTVLYRPAELDALLDERTRLAAGGEAARRPRIELSAETTSAAGRRLVEVEREGRVLALNFASARNPGGGFLRGAKAQEEDLARASALYPCLVAQREYYETNRAMSSLLYSDHIIYSPDVPFFRDDELALLERPFALSILTAPAPNAGEELRRDPGAGPALSRALEARAGKLLAVAARHGHRCLVLGAWGCGVFRNDPREVAEVFARWLAHPAFAPVFERVLFAIYDRSAGRGVLGAFAARLGLPVPA
jgi:uncharacterized protein (TIGR02452 family)